MYGRTHAADHLGQKAGRGMRHAVGTVASVALSPKSSEDQNSEYDHHNHPTHDGDPVAKRLINSRDLLAVIKQVLGLECRIDVDSAPQNDEYRYDLNRRVDDTDYESSGHGSGFNGSSTIVAAALCSISAAAGLVTV